MVIFYLFLNRNKRPSSNNLIQSHILNDRFNDSDFSCQSKFYKNNFIRSSSIPEESKEFDKLRSLKRKKGILGMNQEYLSF